MPVRQSLVRKARQYKVTIKVPGYPDTVYNEPFVREAVNTVVTGNNLPDWQWRITNGINATTSMIGTKYSVPKWSTYNSFQQNGIQEEYATGYGTQWTDWPSSYAVPLTKAVTLAEQNFAKDYRGRTRSFQGGAFLVELAETAAMLANPIRGMYNFTWDFAHRLQKIKRLPARRYRAALGDAWLTYAFGIKPLASDANEYMDALDDLKTGGDTTELTRIFGTGSDDEEQYEGMLYETPGGVYMEFRASEIRKTEVKIRGAVRIKGDVPPMQRFGLSMLDIIPSVWEGIPFSFLIDYFSNAGQCLDTLQLRWVDFAWLNQTIRNRSERIRGDCKAPSPGYAYGGGARFVTKYVDRQVRSNDFGGPLHFRMPGAGSVKWLNTTALASAFLNSRWKH